MISTYSMSSFMARVRGQRALVTVLAMIGLVSAHRDGDAAFGYREIQERQILGETVPITTEVVYSTVTNDLGIAVSTTVLGSITLYSLVGAGAPSASTEISDAGGGIFITITQANPTSPLTSVATSIATSASTSPSVTSISRETSATSLMPSSPAEQTTASNGLSLGAKVGIGVAIPLVVIVGVAFGVYLFLRKKKSKRRGSVESVTMSQTGDYPEVLEPGAVFTANSKTEEGIVATVDVPNEKEQGAVGQAPNPNSSSKLESPPLFAPTVSETVSDLPEVVHEMGTSRPIVNGPYSDLPESVGEGDDPVLRRIREDRERLNERRTRLMEMERLDEEERELRRQEAERVAQIRRMN